MRLRAVVLAFVVSGLASGSGFPFGLSEEPFGLEVGLSRSAEASEDDLVTPGSNRRQGGESLSGFGRMVLRNGERARSQGIAQAAWRENIISWRGGHPAWRGRLEAAEKELKALGLWPW